MWEDFVAFLFEYMSKIFNVKFTFGFKVKNSNHVGSIRRVLLCILYKYYRNIKARKIRGFLNCFNPRTIAQEGSLDTRCVPRCSFF